MTEIIKIIGLIAFASVKFFLAPPATILAGYSFFETLAITISGGIIGVFIFFYFGEFIKGLFSKYWKRNKKKKIFTKSSRRMANIKVKYGLIGLAFLTPCLFSIPIGCFIAARYFDHDKKTIPYLILSVLFWSITLTSASLFLRGLV